MKTNKFTRLLALAGLGVSLAGAGSVGAAETSNCCTGRIVGGVEAPRNAYPWMAALVRPGYDAFNGQFCGGSLISPRIVLSAAHCVAGRTPSQVEVILGIHYLSQPGSSRRFTVSRIIVHPNYSGANNGYDLALLELSEPATGFATIPLVSSASQIPDGAVVRAIGWGALMENGSYPDELRQVDVPIVNMQTAVQRYTSSGFSLANTATMLAAGNLSGGQDTCQGDSGGPLVRSINGQWVLVGATSWGAGCARPNLPGFYGNILSMRDWVLAQMQNPGGGTPTTDDHGNDMAHATAVSDNGSTGGVINSSGDPDFFRFTIATNSQVTLRTTGSMDTMGALFNQAGSMLASNDDADGGLNFRITTTLSAGTYFVRVTGFGSATGSYVLVRSAQPLAQPEIAVLLGTSDIPTGGSQAFGSLLTGQAVDRTFTILNSGNASLGIQNLTMTGSAAFRVVTLPAASILPGRTSNFVVRFAPTSAGSHSATLRIANNDANENPFVLVLSGSATVPIVDDFPNTLGSSSYVVSVGGSVNGRLERMGDADTFRFYLSRTTSVRIQTTGSTDTYGHLYNSSRTQIMEDDDSGYDFNFLMARTLAPGWYYVKVRGFADVVTGAYTLRISAQ
jgi:secreted trypsin-like serine protease